MNLKKLTNRDKGIICFLDKSIAVVHWDKCGDDTIPLISRYFTGIRYMSIGAGALEVERVQHAKDIKTVLPYRDSQKGGQHNCYTGLCIVYDPNDYIYKVFQEEAATGGMVYHLHNGIIIITPDDEID